MRNESGTAYREERRVQQYEILMSYLQYENSAYWGRANFFLVASIAFAGFVMTNIPSFEEALSWKQVFTFLVSSLIGLSLSFLWWKSLQSGEFWIDRWHFLLKKIEPDVFGDMEVIRGMKQREGGPSRVSARRISRLTVGLFGVLWSLALIYSFVLIYIKTAT